MVDLLTVLFGETAPDAVLFADQKSVLATVLPHRAWPADRDRGGVTFPVSCSSVVFGVEEEHGVGFAAGRAGLPLPGIG